MEQVHNNRILKDRRRELRKGQTPQEEKLWFELRNSKLGIKFKRQHSIGGYIADFYCQKYQLLVEIDGEIHNSREAREYDKIRDEYLSKLGFKILRVSNDEIDNEIENVLRKIAGLSPSPAFRRGAELPKADRGEVPVGKII